MVAVEEVVMVMFMEIQVMEMRDGDLMQRKVLGTMGLSQMVLMVDRLAKAVDIVVYKEGKHSSNDFLVLTQDPIGFSSLCSLSLSGYSVLLIEAATQIGCQYFGTGGEMLGV